MIKREGDCWYVVFACKIDTNPRSERQFSNGGKRGEIIPMEFVLRNASWYEASLGFPYTDLAIGIDMGFKHFTTDSNGDMVDNPRFFRKSHGKLKSKQQRLAKKKRGSNRRKRAVKLVAKAHKKIRNQRRDFHHKQARVLVGTFGTIVFEDLSMHHMVKRPKVKQDENGKYLPDGAGAKAGLNKSILDAGWASFIELVKHESYR